MVTVFAVREVDVDINDKTDEIVISLVSGSGNTYTVSAGTFNRNDSTAMQNRQLKAINEKMGYVRNYFIKFGSMPDKPDVKL